MKTRPSASEGSRRGGGRWCGRGGFVQRRVVCPAVRLLLYRSVLCAVSVYCTCSSSASERWRKGTSNHSSRQSLDRRKTCLQVDSPFLGSQTVVKWRAQDKILISSSENGATSAEYKYSYLLKCPLYERNHESLIRDTCMGICRGFINRREFKTPVLSCLCAEEVSESTTGVPTSDSS